ncbi:MAG: hypothetical protein A2X81_02955 [Desulfobacterales bacterium GWB2_56_26]|nr:MAG: hypothetical protein A2X81_02955 [Desulfobacterales bacterium GWB2_56_26]
MTTFILTMTITFVLLPTIGFFIGFSKRRQRQTKHGLTGMCHKTGGEMCGCCSSSLLHVRPQTRQSSCDRAGSPPSVHGH